jgi:uncharacterized protein
MKNLKERINADYIEAFKSKETVRKGILSVVKGEIQTIEKNIGTDNLDDAEILKILQKTSKSLKETISYSNDEKSIQELEIIENYLPKQMSKEEINSKLNELISNGFNNIGLIMKEFKDLPADKKIVSELLKELL